VPFLSSSPTGTQLLSPRNSYHDLDWVKREKGGDLRQIDGYVETTARYTPKLFARVRQAIADSAVPVPFVLHVGDLVEGLCGSRDLHATQCREAIAAVEEAKLGAPVIMAKGNHDITGPGAPESFNDVLLPWMARQAKQDLRAASYTVQQGDDLFVVFDAYKPDLDWLDKTLAGSKSARTFFIIHPPVVPYNARANWTIFPTEKTAPQRRRLLDLLARRSAIVISGHLHRYAVVERQSAAGSFTQLAVCSVLRGETATPREELAGVDHYTPENLLATEPHFAPTTTEVRKKIIQDEAPAIRRFEHADLPGFAMVTVHERGVAFDYYAATATKPARTGRL
jgi:UDP-2,3-diacylglucosamine pyrophosphatase LpxH